ncbi:MAG: IPT/TIG domain-containing protein, partial [Alistipes sp.]|nr:IPT/TIG domain-containing protein [Alistipes sp.]
MLCGLLALSMMSCNDAELSIETLGVQGDPHDPTQPIEITDFSPKEGGAGQQMVIYGKNFGNDPSIIKVAVGGAEAVVVSSNGTAIYCLIPSKSTETQAPDFNGSEEDEVVPEASATRADDASLPEGEVVGTHTVSVGVGPQGSMKQAVFSEGAFAYKKVWRVGTLLGKVNDKNELEVKDGPFEDCGNFYKPQMFAVDPLNENHLYVSGDNNGDVRLIDFENEYVYTIIKGNTTPGQRIRSVSFCPTNILKRRQDGSIKELYPDFELEAYPADGDVGAYDLILTHDHFTATSPAVTLYRRNRGGSYTATDEFGETGYTIGEQAFKNSDRITVATGIACNGAYVHP